MRYPWVNVVLLGLVVFQILSGFTGLVTGVSEFGWILRLHDIGGYGVLLLLAWKAAIVVDALKRRPRLGPARIAFLVLAALVLLILATGLVWPIAGYVSVAGTSLMTIHALLVIALVILFTWHTLARRFVFRTPSALDRRAFLRTAGITLAGLATWQLSEFAQVWARLPGALRRPTGSFETGSHTGIFPTVSWLTDSPAPIAAEGWKLVIDGAVVRPITLTYLQIGEMVNDSIEEIIDCTGGWYSVQTFHGVQLARLIDMVGLVPTAASITVHSVTGYSRRFSVQEARGCLLATRVAGQILDHGHGFPLRLVAPGERGLNWVKWVTRIEVNETSALWQPVVPLQ